MRRFGRNLRETTFEEFGEMSKRAGRGMSIGSMYHHAFMVNPEFWCTEIEAELGSCTMAQNFSDLLPEEQKVMMALVKSGVRAPEESASAPLKKNNSWSPTNETVRLTTGQLKRIIREEYSRLKQQGLIRESHNPNGTILDLASRPGGVNIEELISMFGKEVFATIDELEEAGLIYMEDDGTVISLRGY